MVSCIPPLWLTDVPADVDVASHVGSQLDGANLGSISLTETGETPEGKSNQQTSHEEHGFIRGKEEDEDDGNADGVIDHE